MKKFIKIIIIFLIFFESASFVATKFQLLLFNEIPSYSLKEIKKPIWYKKDDDGNLIHKKNYSTRHQSRCFDVIYQFNNIGARDDKDYNNTNDNNSIILIGDSFAEGYGVNLEHTFAKLLEKQINKKVLNFGVSSTDPKSQSIKYIKNESNFNFDELIYFFLPYNDFISLNTNNHSIKKKINFLALKNKITNFLSKFTYSYNFIRSASYVLNIDVDNYLEDHSYFYDNSKNIDYTFRYIKNIIVHKKVKSYIVIIPTIYDINNYLKNNKNYKDLYWYQKLNNIAEDNNTIFIDLMDFIDFDLKKSYFHTCDGHWNKIGNSFAANIFLKFYNKN